MKKPGGAPKRPITDKEARLAAALRDNLRRRKKAAPKEQSAKAARETES